MDRKIFREPLRFRAAEPKGSLFPHAVIVHGGAGFSETERVLRAWLTEYFGSADIGSPDRRWFNNWTYFAFRDETDLVLFTTAWNGESIDA